MAEQISINITAVQTILRKLKILEEEAKLLVSETDKTIQNAELEGWNDIKYHEFKEQFFDSKNMIMQGIKRIEEEHIPFLKKLLHSAEEF